MLVRLLALSLLVGCAPSDARSDGAEAPGVPTAESVPPADVPPRAEAAAADTVDADLSAVPDELKTCVAASVREGGLRFEVVGAVEQRGTRYVLVEGYEPDGALGVFSFVPRLLRVEGQWCENVLVLGTDDYDIRGFVGDDYDDLIRQAAASEVDRVGGAAAFESAYREAGWPPLHACAEGESASDTGCFEPAWAAGYRAAGVTMSAR